MGGLDSCTAVEVRGDRADRLAGAVRRAWSRCLDGTDAAPSAAVTATLDEDADLDRALQTLTQEVTRAKIAAGVGRLLMLHAGAVCHPASGATLAFVAPGGTGKTTLARLLGRQHGYLTDETLALGLDGRVHPYPKPLSLRVTGASAKREASPDELGLLPAHPEPRLRRLVLLARNGTQAEPRFEELGILDAIMALCPESSSLSALPRPLHVLAELLDRLPPVLRVHYSEAATVARPLTALVEDT